MVYFIIAVAVIFVLMIISLNSEKIRKALRDKKPKEKSKKNAEPKDKPEKSKLPANMSYKEFVPIKKVDDLGNADDEFEFTTLNELNEEESKELENKSKSKGGRLSGDVKSATIEEVEVEDLGEFDGDDGNYQTFDGNLDNSEFDNGGNFDDSDDLFTDDGFVLPSATKQKSISQEIKNLSPELKALLIDNVLNKKDDV